MAWCSLAMGCLRLSSILSKIALRAKMIPSGSLVESVSKGRLRKVASSRSYFECAASRNLYAKALKRTNANKRQLPKK